MNCSYCYRSSVFGKKFGITFHCFPKDVAIKNLWIKACTSHKCILEDFKPKSRLCSDHFTLNDFGENKKLKRGAVPTRFSYKPHMHCIACHEIHDKDSRIFFYEFPEEKNMKKLWQESCSKNGVRIMRVLPEHSICSNHFSKECFNNAGTQRSLKLDAVPSLFFCIRNSEITYEPHILETISSSEGPLEKTSQNNILCKNTKITNETHLLEAISSPEELVESISLNQIKSEELIETGSGHQGCKRHLDFADSSVSKSPPRKSKKLKLWRPVRAGDLTEDHFSTPREAKRNFRIISTKCKQYQKKLNNYRTQTWKLKQKIKTLESLFHLSEKNLISQENLNGSAGDILRLIVERRLENKTTKKYSPELRTFALTLHFYSAKAYEYVRKSFNNVLPHPKYL